MSDEKLEKYVKSIQDFPVKGVLFRDVTGILDSGEGFRLAMIEMEMALSGVPVDKIAAPESRGFIFGAALADRLRCAFVPIRKPGKLPRETICEEYELEYGKAAVEMHTDAIRPGQKVVVVDDLIATGGTVAAICRLVERLGGEVAKICFVMELAGLKGREALKPYEVESLIIYEGK